MLNKAKFGSFLLTAALSVGILPVRPLILALSAHGAAQQCLLHGADCQCLAHCDRERHSRDAQETAAVPACHRDPAGQTALSSNVPTEPTGDVEFGDDAPGPAAGCAMTSCGNEAPLLLTSQGMPCLAASTAPALYRDPAVEAMRIADSFACFSLEASPPTPPPES